MTTATARGIHGKPKILVVDDDDAIREVLRDRLSDAYEVDETSNSERALELVLQNRPDCILLDLLMPGYTGLELCQTLASLSFTQMIPVFVITGQPATNYKDYCLGLGAKEFFEKPLDFSQLRTCLAKTLKNTAADRRMEPRIRIKVSLLLQGVDKFGARFEAHGTTDNVSVNGFSCGVDVSLEKDSIIELALVSDSKQLVGRARVVRIEKHAQGLTFYGFRITEKHGAWILE